MASKTHYHHHHPKNHSPPPPFRRLTRASKIRPATLFTPQDATLSPEAHFPLQTVSTPNRTPFPRFINRFDSREILLVADGSCLNNGRHHLFSPPRPTSGSWLLLHLQRRSHRAPIPTSTNPNPDLTPFLGPDRLEGSIAFPLEQRGPTGAALSHTSNRAKLRAVIAALQFRAWGGEGWRRVVVLTDLEYVVLGATRWLPRWVERGWKRGGRSSSTPGARGRRGRGRGMGNGGGLERKGGGYLYGNRDLWEELQGQVEELRRQGCEVAFWLVKGDGVFMQRAKEAARRAARGMEGEWEERFGKLLGVMV